MQVHEHVVHVEGAAGDQPSMKKLVLAFGLNLGESTCSRVCAERFTLIPIRASIATTAWQIASSLT